jgi:hypothetical protein
MYGLEPVVFKLFAVVVEDAPFEKLFFAIPP